MITTNMPEFVQHLSRLGDVRVHDTMETIQLHLPASVDPTEVDDLVCDALFADPLGRERAKDGIVVHLFKRAHLRGVSDMRILQGDGGVRYEVLQRA